MSDYIENINILDLDEIAIIEKKAYRNPWTKRHFKSDINQKYSLNYKYVKNNKLIGYLFGYLIEDEYHLNKITVKEKFRARKIGKILLSYCLKKIADKNVKYIHLEVSSSNVIAQNFYRSFNFVNVGVRKKYYSKYEDALLYNLEIK